MLSEPPQERDGEIDLENEGESVGKGAGTIGEKTLEIGQKTDLKRGRPNWRNGTTANPNWRHRIPSENRSSRKINNARPN